jgi:hypothetical protein
MGARVVTKVPECRDSAEHAWRLVTHIDGCHFHASTYACDVCRATLYTSHERDIEGDPYSAVWMADEGGPEDERCERCRELMAGAKVRDPEIDFEVAK